ALLLGTARRTLPQKPRELVLHVTPSEKANEATYRRRSGCRPRDTGQSRPEPSWTREACDRCRGTSCTTWSYRVPAPAFPTTANRNTSHLAVSVTLAGSGIYTDRYARLARWHLACNPVGRFPSPRLRHRGEGPRSTWRMSALGWRCRCTEQAMSLEYPDSRKREASAMFRLSRTSVIAWTAVVVVIAALSYALTGPAARPASAQPKAPAALVEFTADGKLKQPVGYRKWVYVGEVITPNDMNGGEAAFPEFHSVYMDPESFAEYEKTGKYRD